MNVDKRKTQVEVLAPAGSLDIMKAVVAAGADAIYLGGNMFGARAFANNFNDEELICAIEYAHLFGRKVYLTVNTLLKSREIENSLIEYLIPFYEAGLDAVIVQDMGVFKSRSRSAIPNFSVLPGSGYSCKHTDDTDRSVWQQAFKGTWCNKNSHFKRDESAGNKAAS